MLEEVSILLAGIGGYGEEYAEALLEGKPEKNVRIAGVVDINPEASRAYGRIREQGISVFSSMEEFYQNKTADLAVLSTPIHLHYPQACTALANGSNVLCEKPLCAVMEELFKLRDASMKAGRFIAVGFQMAYSNAVQNLKRDIIAGFLGQPRRFKTMVSSPRWESYYQRNRWAGRIRDEEGNWILDSVASNATAHYLHNMLFLLGREQGEAAVLKGITAEIYRANRIENYDTAAVRLFVENGTEIFYYATHAGEDFSGPEFFFEFEDAEVFYRSVPRQGRFPESAPTGSIVARLRDGSFRNYGNPLENQMNKLWRSIEAVRAGGEIACGIEAAASHVLCIEGMQRPREEISVFPPELICMEEKPGNADRRLYVKGLNEAIIFCYDCWRLPGEVTVDWARKGEYRVLE